MEDSAAILFEYQKIFIISFKMQIKELPVHHFTVTKAAPAAVCPFWATLLTVDISD